MDEPISKKVIISGDQLLAMLKILQKNPRELLLSEECRRFLALDRWKKDRYLRIHAEAETGEAVMPGTVEHNRKELETDGFGSVRRTLRLINPLTSLEPVYSAAPQLKVLSIGPRTEMELLHLIGVGFSMHNLFAIDLISSSPMIETGDMHKLPYADGAFDVVISSWVLGYSSNPKLAVDEMVRVTKHNGLVAVGMTYDPATEQTKTDITGCNYGTADELKALIGPKLDRVHFEEDPRGQKGGVMLVARIKHK